MDREKYRTPGYVDDGMEVFAPAWALGIKAPPGTGIRCVVACAAGNHARVENRKRGISKWFHIGDLTVARSG